MEANVIRLNSDMYSLTVDVNPLGPVLLYVLAGLNDDILSRCRYRDGYLSKDFTKVILYTRIGGGNRPDYSDVIKELRSNKNYIKDYDDEFDSTFASFEFKIPEDNLPKVAAFFTNTDTRTGAEKSKESMDWMERDPDGFLKAHPELDKQMKEIYKQMGIL